MFEKFNALLLKFWADRSGVTAVEYGVIAAAVVVGIVVLVYSVGDKIELAFDTLEKAIK